MFKYKWLLLDADNTFLDFTSASKKSLFTTCDDYNLNCDEEIPYTDLVTAYDNCPSIAIDVVESSTQGEEGCTLYDYQITRNRITKNAQGFDSINSENC